MMSPSTYSLRFRLLAAFSFTFLLVLITHVLEDLGPVYVGKETADLIKEPRWGKYLVLCECGGKGGGNTITEILRRKGKGWATGL